MNLLVSWFLVFATLAGVFTGTEGICLDDREARIVSAGVTPPHSNASPEPDCHHEGSPCHTCHLGHCAFVVSTVSAHLNAPLKEVLPLSYLVSLPSDYASSLFRPPIA